METKIIKRAVDLLTPEDRRRAGAVLGLSLLTAIFEVVGVASVLPFLGLAADPTMVEQNAVLHWVFESFGFDTHRQFLLAVGVAVLLIILATAGLTALTLWMQLRFSWWLNHSISHRLLRTYLGRPYERLLVENRSDLRTNVLSESQKIADGVFRPALTVCSKGLVVVSILGVLLYMEPLITLGALAGLGSSYALIYTYLRNRLQTIGEEAVKSNKARYKVTSEAFDVLKEVKLHNHEAVFSERYELPSKEYADQNALRQVWAQLPSYAIQALLFGGLMVVLLSLLAAGRTIVEIVPVMGFFAYAGYRLMPAFRKILEAGTSFRYYGPILEVIHTDLHIARSHSDSGLGESSPTELTFEERIAVDGLTYRYPGSERPALEDVTLEIGKNTSAAFVGSTGAGKSTLVDLLLGLLEPQEGAILVDDAPLQASNVRSWQGRIGYVPQEIVLLDDTVERNIALGVRDEEINRERVEQAASIAHIHDFVEGELPEGYGTAVGERGIRLSGGQRQRIGIARALYHDPEVLIFDEATSDIDNVTEANITRAIEELTGTKTLILVAHRISTVEACGVIYVLEHGQVVDQGSYDELIESSQRFQDLARGTSHRPADPPMS